ncbi:MAG: hypothetical protein M1455_06410 [Actinobacteria bacterium]|nr:hypothetical protein [Actinomycetota bacterium]
MARGNVTPFISTPAGTTLIYVTPTVDGIMIPGDGQTKLIVRNANAAACTVTIQTPEQRAGLDVAEQTVTIPATTGEKIIGPFPQSTFNRPSGGTDPGKVYIDFSIQASVSYAAIK